MSLFVPRDRKSLFRQFLGGMYDAVVITDPSGHILEINSRAVEHFGRTAEEVSDQPISTYIPGITPEVVQRIRRGLENDRHVMIDANGVHCDGHKIACEVTVSVIDLMDPGDLVFTIRNVERRRDLMNCFRARSNAFDLAKDALFGCDVKLRVRDCNAAFRDLFGLAADEPSEKHLITEFLCDDPLPTKVSAALAGENSEVCLVADDDTGSQEHLEITLAPNWHGRRIHGVVGCIRRV